MPEQKIHSNESWRSLDTLIKYVKGNLLGQKKQEVEDQAMASPLVSDAIDGLKEVGNLAKTQSIVDALNRQIQIKSGAATPPKISETKTPSGIKANPKAILLAAASVVVIISASIGFYLAFNQSADPAQKTDALVQYEEKKIANNHGNASNNEEAIALDTADLAAEDTVKTIALLEENDEAQQDEPVKTREDASEKTLYKTEKPDGKNKNLEDKKVTAKEKVEEVEVIKEEESSENGLKSNALNNSNNNYEGRISTDSTKDFEDSGYASGYGKFKSKNADSDAISYTDAIKHLEKEEYDKAIAEFEAISQNKNSSYQNDSYWNLAQIYLKQGDTRSAKKMLKKLKGDAKYGDQAEKLLDDL